jgi:hypothetical protein
MSKTTVVIECILATKQVFSGFPFTMNPATGEYSANPRRSRIARQSSRVWGQRISANHDTDTINYSTRRGFHVRVTKVVASQCFWRLMRGRIKGSEISLRANFAEQLPMGLGNISKVSLAQAHF